MYIRRCNSFTNLYGEDLANNYKGGHPRINFDHQHHYRQEFDAASKSLLNKYDWVYSPLKASDVQGVY